MCHCLLASSASPGSKHCLQASSGTPALMIPPGITKRDLGIEPLAAVDKHVVREAPLRPRPQLFQAAAVADRLPGADALQLRHHLDQLVDQRFAIK